MEWLAKSADAVGMIGVFLILLTYYLLSANKLSAHTMKYQFSNFIGAWFILYSLYFHWNTSSVMIETCWIVISMIGMYRCLFAK